MNNKNFVYTIAIILLTISIGCKKYLNVNSDPATPQNPSGNSIFPAVLSAIPRGIQLDARFLGRYIQNWQAVSGADTWDRHGYISGSDNSGEIWRQTYFGLGLNLDYIIEDGIKKQQYDFVGACYALKAFMFQTATDYHGEIIFTEAFKKNTYYFKYDSQQVVYEGVKLLCRNALQYLDMAAANGNVSLKAGDYVYTGDISKWKKFVYGILARNYVHLINKTTSYYKADSVIQFCDNALSSGGDDFLIAFNGAKNDDANYFGPSRDNIGTVRQSNFIVKLLDGTILAGNSVSANRDPRISHMLSASGDTTNGNGGYRGVDPAAGDPFNATTEGPAAKKRVAVLWGDSLYTNQAINGKYLFQNKVVMPVMTYAEIQFIKAEAAFKKNNKALAYTAYLNGINAHFDFINRAGIYNGSPISNTARSAYLASKNVAQNSDSLTLKDIMLQKYIALWGWGFVETWVDLRKYHYYAMGSDTVYKGFVLPTPLFIDNSNKPAYRVRPRYNSEYVWNMSELKRIGADKPDYHTYECWFSNP